MKRPELCLVPCPGMPRLKKWECHRKKGHHGDHQRGYEGGNCVFWPQAEGVGGSAMELARRPLEVK